jgi:membrane protein DedA with SNARE-associated domain
MWTLAALFTAQDMERWWAVIENVDPVFALIAVFVLLFLAGCGLPVPEDIPLIFTGILLGLPGVHAAYGGKAEALAIVAVACYSAILTGDLVAYHIGRKWGLSVAVYPPFKWALSERRVERLQSWYHRFGSWTVFFGRMVAGIRFVSFVCAGMARMSRTKFILFDSLAALVTVPFWIVVGYVLGTHFRDIAVWMSRVSRTTWLLVGLLILVLFGNWLYRRLRRRKVEHRNVGILEDDRG